jgi:hypothetical protein
MPMSDFTVTQEALDDRGTQGFRHIAPEPSARLPSQARILPN